MSELHYLLLLFTIFCIINSSISIESSNNSTENISQSINYTNTSDEQEDYVTKDEYEDPFKDTDFGNLIEIKEDNMDEILKNNDNLYIVFYAPWCAVCDEFFPIFVNTSKYAEEKNMTIKFARLDVSNILHVPDEFKVERYPTIYLKLKQEKFLYKGEAKQEAFFRFLNRKLNDDVYEVKTLEEIDEYVKNSSLVLLSTLRHEEVILYKSFLNFSKTALNIEFLKCFTLDCVKKYRQDIILFKKYDEKINQYTLDVGYIAEATMDSVKEFVATYSVEAGGILNDTQIEMMFDYNRKMLFYFRDSEDKEQTKYDKVIKELGKDFRKNKIYTTVSDIKGNPIAERMEKDFIIAPEDLPLLIFYTFKSNSTDDDNILANIYSIKGAEKEQLTKEYINEYINKINEGKIREDLFSERPLKDYNKDGLKYIIGRTFDKDVIEEKNNVLLNFIEENMYCPECFSILDIMRNLSKKYSEEKKVIFAYIDVGKNQPRDIDLGNEVPPLVLLYTNNMPEKKIIKMTHKNWTLINEEYIENFLAENLNWENKKKVNETKESFNQKEEAKKENINEDKNEIKKEPQTDL